MKLIVYNNFLNITSSLLNFCVRYQFWKMAKSLVEFRKRHIASPMRTELVKS
jgi:hypothetical protein